MFLWAFGKTPLFVCMKRSGSVMRHIYDEGLAEVSFNNCGGQQRKIPEIQRLQTMVALNAGSANFDQFSEVYVFQRCTTS